MYDSMLDAVGYLLFATLLGSFAFWMIGYFCFELIAHAVRGPSEQLRSVGSSILANASVKTLAPAASRGFPVVTEKAFIPPKAA